MGEFTGGSVDHTRNAQDDENISKSGADQGSYQTDVPDIEADDVIKKGMEEYPVFDVTPQEFFSNMSADRKKIRFKNGSKVTTYKNKTKNTGRPFYIKTTASDGKTYTRKIR